MNHSFDVGIKPIETIYNGYRFRSRLEARWAVFFDEASIDYQYEPEGFVLKDGTKYLPDFYLPTFKAFVEIKHGNLDENAKEEAERKCECLSDELTDSIVFICYGDPVDMDMRVFCHCWEEMLGRYIPLYDSAIFVEDGKWWKAYCLKNGHTIIQETYDRHYKINIAVGSPEDNTVSELEPNFLIPRCLLIKQESFLETARNKARQARFEHGETPTRKR